MAQLSVGEKYVQLYHKQGRPGLWLAFSLLLAFVFLLPTLKNPDHLAGFKEGLGAVVTVSFWTSLSMALNNWRRVVRLYRIGDVLHVHLWSFPGFPRSFTCPVGEAHGWQKLGSGRRSRLIFHHQGTRYLATLAGGSFIDARAMADTYPELVRVFGYARRPVAQSSPR